MNARKTSPVFLERRSYRRRRLLDALRLLPVLGVVLWMLPVLWPTGLDETTAPVSMSMAMLYVFSVWLVLILLSAALWIWLRMLDRLQ